MSAGCPECEEGLPEWIMSYADMITILMAFFVVMYSMAGSGTDEAKEEAVMHSLRVWLGNNSGAWPGPEKSGSSKRPRGSGNSDNPQRPVVPTIKGKDSFATGNALYFNASYDALTEDNKERLRATVEVLSGKLQRVEIRGQASRRPLAEDAPFQEPVDLAFARCRMVMDFLVSLGIKPERIQVRVSARPPPGGVDDDPRLLVDDSRVDVFLLDEFIDRPGTDPLDEKPAAAANPE